MANKPTIVQIRESLIRQLEERGGNVAHFAGLIEDYIFLDTMERRMQADVKKRGVVYSAMSANKGITIEKENPSVKSAVNYNKQKLSILDKLGLTVDNAAADNYDEL